MTSGNSSAARKKAKGTSKAVFCGSTLRYSSPYPRSINPDPTPVHNAPAAPRGTCAAPGSVMEEMSSVPAIVRAGPSSRNRHRFASASRCSPRNALANSVAHRATVDPVNTMPGTGWPFHVTQLTAAPKNMR